MNEEKIAGIALRDLIDLGAAIPGKVGDRPDDQKAYWEWLVASAMTLGYQVVVGREGPKAASAWVKRVFEFFTTLTKEKGQDVRVVIIEKDSPGTPGADAG